MLSNKHISIKNLILSAALIVSIILFIGIYFAVSSIYASGVKENARTTSQTLANITFSSMYQVMSQGWTRIQLEGFIESLQTDSKSNNYSISIYRAPIVSQKFGTIQQSPPDQMVLKAITSGKIQQQQADMSIRNTYPLLAEKKCLTCHNNAKIGQTLGVIDVKQNLSALIQQTSRSLFSSILAFMLLPMAMAMVVAVFVSKKINISLAQLSSKIEKINKVSDLANIHVQPMQFGLTEFNNIFDKIKELSDKLKSVAVDKDLLEFEIRLLEKFVITSEVVKDWREYISYLLSDINEIIEAHTLFSIFKIDDELFDLEVFWLHPPTKETKIEMEASIKKSLSKNPLFDISAAINIQHNIAHPDSKAISLNEQEITLQTKSLYVETPKIGGIVGIGVHSDIVKDSTRLLVMESILSTLLNVVGSVKAIYKYTRDLEYYATRDPLTELYNQRLFWELLSYEVIRAERHNYKFSLLVIDLDNFKNINDSYGHAFGDKFLQDISAKIREALRGGDILARYGGDEFVVILPEADIEQASQISQRILQYTGNLCLQSPENNPVKSTLSIGIAVYPDHAKEIKDLFLFADNMMYKAKGEGKNCVRLPSENDLVEVFKDIGEKSMIISAAIETKSVIPYFQPILGLGNNTIEAIEVLSRIQLDDKTILNAHEFIEIAEKMSVIHKLDYVVMEKAFELCKSSQFKGLIFVNLSPKALILSEFIPKVKQLIESSGLNTTQIVFEITERETVKNLSLLEKFVSDLKAEGFKFAIDDFGSGFSSFHYLKNFPVDFVKIEGDFVRNMVNDKRDVAFVKSISHLAHELGAQTIAEFVEDEETIEYLKLAGVTHAQGYHIGKPDKNIINNKLSYKYKGI
ncbi:MAG: EAL domain-containing protein [Pseudomonadota bacterium]